MKTFILILVCVLLGFFAIYAFIMAEAERRARKKEQEENKKNAEETRKKYEEASKTKADARSGNHERDLKFMADKLREYNARN